MAKKKKAKPTGTAAILLADTENTGPYFSMDASECLGATLHDVREAVKETAIKRAKGVNPVPLSSIKVALLEHGLGWALVNPDKKEEK